MLKMPSSSFTNLPVELLQEILSYLPNDDLLTLRLVSSGVKSQISNKAIYSHKTYFFVKRSLRKLVYLSEQPHLQHLISKITIDLATPYFKLSKVDFETLDGYTPEHDAAFHALDKCSTRDDPFAFESATKLIEGILGKFPNLRTLNFTWTNFSRLGDLEPDRNLLEANIRILKRYHKEGLFDWYPSSVSMDTSEPGRWMFKCLKVKGRYPKIYRKVWKLLVNEITDLRVPIEEIQLDDIITILPSSAIDRFDDLQQFKNEEDSESTMNRFRKLDLFVDNCVRWYDEDYEEFQTLVASVRDIRIYQREMHLSEQQSLCARHPDIPRIPFPLIRLPVLTTAHFVNTPMDNISLRDFLDINRHTLRKITGKRILLYRRDVENSQPTDLSLTDKNGVLELFSIVTWMRENLELEEFDLDFDITFAYGTTIMRNRPAFGDRDFHSGEEVLGFAKQTPPGSRTSVRSQDPAADDGPFFVGLGTMASYHDRDARGKLYPARNRPVNWYEQISWLKDWDSFLEVLEDRCRVIHEQTLENRRIW